MRELNGLDIMRLTERRNHLEHLRRWDNNFAGAKQYLDQETYDDSGTGIRAYARRKINAIKKRLKRETYEYAFLVFQIYKSLDIAIGTIEPEWMQIYVFMNFAGTIGRILTMAGYARLYSITKGMFSGGDSHTLTDALEKSIASMRIPAGLRTQLIESIPDIIDAVTTNPEVAAALQAVEDT